MPGILRAVRVRRFPLNWRPPGQCGFAAPGARVKVPCVPEPISTPAQTPAASSVGAAPRRALVTGGAQRLGREIALALGRAGWDIAVHFGRSEREALATVADIQALGRHAVAVQADLADEASVSALFDAACARLGGLDCVVNNASRFEPDRPETFAYAQLQAHMAPNLAAPLLLARRLHALHASRPETTTRRGVIVNVLDQKLENLNPDFLSYTLSKAALHSATRMLAM
ncbi:MAG: SDR family NAD(P)-dependent oxidoreductase, partial [Burkholderiaceae bacterium]|nr:SDR family NAD(P)-dependent oxidoreductase [Burkholderiaceae bacterium]